MSKIGIIGGTFNPIHVAHLLIAETFCYEMNLDKCLFIPAFLSPFKTEITEAIEIAPEHRVSMVKSAIAVHPKFELCLFEIEKQGVSRSIDTIKHLKANEPENTYFLLIGDDQAVEFTRWGSWQEILQLVQLCIVNRNRSLSIEQKGEIDSKLSINSKKTVWIDFPFLEISSTDIREKVRNGKSIKYIVPETVESYIYKYGLYK